jgi:hypothetical protein
VVVVKASQGGDFTIEDLPPGTYAITYATADVGDLSLPDVVVQGNGRLSTRIPRDGVITIRSIHTRVVGDSNGDGIFDSGDLLQVFGVGEYEDGIPGNSTFDEGDWNGDGDFDSGDLIHAFEAGNYVDGPSPASVAAAMASYFDTDDRLRKRSPFVA